jgi:Urease alpha-subunit, N-terminal domain
MLDLSGSSDHEAPPSTGDCIRHADTDLVILVERDQTAYGKWLAVSLDDRFVFATNFGYEIRLSSCRSRKTCAGQ